MRVEVYSDQYFLDVVRLIEKFHKEYLTDFFGNTSKDVISETIERYKTLTFLLINEKSCIGVLAGVEIKSKLNKERYFQEIIWYVEAPYGRYGFFLIDQVNQILKSDGFNSIIMSVLESSKTLKIKRIYGRMGFKPMETHYMRSI